MQRETRDLEFKESVSNTFRRGDSASVEVDRLELNRLILAGTNQDFEDLPARTQQLHFQVLEEFMERKIGIRKLDQDILKTLGLFTSKGEYNHAAELLADENTFPGIDIIRFGASIDEIRERKRIEHVSLLTKDVVEKVNIPTKLDEFGVKKEDLDFLVKAGSQQIRLLVNNCKELSLDDIRYLYEKLF